MTPQLTNVLYKPEPVNAYENERCRLDYYAGQPDTGPVLVWFHGGGLTGGDKQDTLPIARALVPHGISVAACNYRFSPVVTYPAYVQDALAAVCWAAAQHPGRPLFVGGHSAGAYLAAMVALQPHANKPALAGAIPMSGQMLTHFTIRTERGLPAEQVTVDEAAPLFYAHQPTVPFCLLVAEDDMAARAEENLLMAVILRNAGNVIQYHNIPQRDHCSIGDRFGEPGDPAAVCVLEFIQRHALRFTVPATP